MHMCHSDVEALRNYSACTKVPNIKTTINYCCRLIVPKQSAEHALCPELSMLWFCTFHRTISCLHVDFECYNLALWPTLRQTFMNFWRILTCPGEKHDEGISSCSLTPQAGTSSQLCRESQDFLTFLMAPLQDSHLTVFGKYHSEIKCFFVE